MDMSVNIAGVEWKNPVTVASGTFGSGAEFADYVDINKLGAVTTKGYTPCSRDHRRNAECYRSSESWNRCFL